MKKIAVATLVLLVSTQTYASNAATVKVGGNCNKLNQTITVKKAKLICSKSGSKLLWKLAAKPSAKPSNIVDKLTIPEVPALITPAAPIQKPAEVDRSSYAFSFANSSGVPGHWSSCTPLTWGYYKSDLANRNLASIIDNLQNLANATGFSFKYVQIESTMLPNWNQITGDVRNLNGPQIQILFAGSDLDPNFKDPKLGGETLVKRLTEVEWSRAYVILNSGNWANLNLPDSDPRGMRNSILHELSHAMGLAHVDYPNQIMNPVASEKGPKSFGKGDLMGLYLVSAAIPCSG